MAKGVKIEVSEDTIRLLAARRIQGISLADIAEEFNLTRIVVTRCLRSEVAKNILKDGVDDAIKEAAMIVRRELSNMTGLAIKALEKNLKEYNLEAVKTYFRALGIEKQEGAVSEHQQAIQVILPGASKPLEKEVESI